MSYIQILDSRQISGEGSFKEPLTLQEIYDKMDNSKIDFISLSHSNSSMKKMGKFPIGTSRAEVEAKVKGTFGGLFESFHENSGTFVYIAYTD